MQPVNPIQQAVEEAVQARPEGLSEYELIRRLERQQAFPPLADEPLLALYQRHFLVRNALHDWRRRLWRESRRELSLDPLRIVLQPPAGRGRGGELADHHAGEEALAAYYLDWNHWRSTTAQEVAGLLGWFQTELEQHQPRRQALAELGLPADAGPELIRRRYRQLAARHHPDRGGDPRRFIAIRRAWECLRGGGGAAGPGAAGAVG